MNALKNQPFDWLLPACGFLSLLGVLGVVELVLVLALGDASQLGQLGLLLLSRLLLPLGLFGHVPEW